MIDGRHSGYGGDVFIDAIHLDRQGGATFSSDVAAIVARRLSGPSDAARWIDLPAYRDVATGVPTEDLTQTLGERKLAFKARQAARR